MRGDLPKSTRALVDSKYDFEAKYNSSMANQAVNQVIADYYRDFSTLNVEAILPYFNEPSLLVGPQGIIPIPDR